MSATAVPIAIAVVQQGDTFLVGIRPSGVVLAGYWEFPGGKLASGETPAAAAVRECLEETGLNIAVDQAYAPFIYHYDYGDVHLHFFLCRPLDSAQTPLAPFRWVPRAELAQLKFPAANERILAELLA